MKIRKLSKKHSLIFWSIGVIVITLIIIRSYIGSLLTSGLGRGLFVTHLSNFLYSFICVWFAGFSIYLLRFNNLTLVFFAFFVIVINLLSEGAMSPGATDYLGILSGVLGVIASFLLQRHMLHLYNE